MRQNNRNFEPIRIIKVFTEVSAGMKRLPILFEVLRSYKQCFIKNVKHFRVGGGSVWRSRVFRLCTCAQKNQGVRLKFPKSVRSCHQ